MKTTHSFIYVVGCLLMVLLLAATPQHAEAQMDSEIFQSILKSDFNALSTVLVNGADVNQQTKVGNTPLMVASKIGDRMILGAILSNKADLNLQNRAGATALMIAAKYGHPHVVTELLNHGADPTIKTNRGYTAANFARAYKHPEIFDQLAEAEKTYETYSGRKAL